MKRLILLLILIFLFSCDRNIENVESLYLKFDNFIIDLGNEKAIDLIEDGFEIDVYEELTISKEIIINDIYYNYRNIGDMGFSGFSEELIFNESYLSYLNIYIYSLPSDIYLDDYLLTENIKDDCDYLKGKYIDKNGKACLLNKNLDNKEISIIFEGDISDINQDKLDRIEIFIEKH